MANIVDVIPARKGNLLHERVRERNGEGWHLAGPVTVCLLDGGYTHYILTWERS